MRAAKLAAIVLMIAQLAASAQVFAVTADELKRALEEKAKAAQEVNDQIQAVNQQINVTQSQKNSLQKELKNIDYNISQLNLGIKSSEINIQKLGLELQSLQLDIDGIRSSINTKRAAIGKLLLELYTKERESSLVVLLKNKSLAASLLESQSIGNLNQGLSVEVKNLKELNSQLDNKFHTTSSKKKNIEVENNTLKNRKGIVQDQKSERATLLAQTQNKEKVYQQQLSELEKKQASISDEIDVIENELRKSFDPSILPVKRPGVLTWPVAKPYLTQHFGEVSSLYRGKPHNGMDLGMPVGTPILASADGVVTATGNNGRYQYGKYVMVKHDNNLVSLYAHLSNNLVVKRGDSVQREQVIGYSGNTGYVVGRGHLHLGLYWEPSVRLENLPNCNCGLVPLGITIDPEPYMGN